jgi:hypothetical protein
MVGLLTESAERRLPQQLRLGGSTLNVTYERLPASATQSAEILKTEKE